MAIGDNEFPERKASFVWDAAGKFRNLTWPGLASEMTETPGGLGILAADLIEMLEYRAAPYRETAWVLRRAATELLSDATSDEALETLARVAALIVLDRRYLEASWLVVRLRTADDALDVVRAAGVLNHLYSVGRSQLSWVLFGLRDFAESQDPLVKTLDVLRSSGKLRPEVLAMLDGPKIFVSYAREDEVPVDALCAALRAQGWDVWRDRERLLPGDAWATEIESVIDSAHFAIPCLSTTAVRKVGFFQVELKRLRARQDFHPTGTAFILPVRLDGCDIPRDLREYHCVDLFPDPMVCVPSLVSGIQKQWAKRYGG